MKTNISVDVCKDCARYLKALDRLAVRVRATVPAGMCGLFRLRKDGAWAATVARATDMTARSCRIRSKRAA